MSKKITSQEFNIDGVIYNSLEDVPAEMRDACKYILKNMDGIEGSDESFVVDDSNEQLSKYLDGKKSKIAIKQVVTDKFIAFSKGPKPQKSHYTINNEAQRFDHKEAQEKSDLIRKAFFLLAVALLIYYIYLVL